MLIEQFEDPGLAHFSYAILSEATREVVLIDPARNPAPYYHFARAHQARIVSVIETHPHADFVSSHLEISQTTGATIRVSRLVGADYPHQGFDEGDAFSSGPLTFRALNTPGHSPDSISIVLSEAGRDVAVFTGDTLFVGDVGRPDLRENAGNLTARREELARQLYHSLHTKLLTLADDVVVYPAHGAGSLCGKALGGASQSTIAAEKAHNPALRGISEAEFVRELLTDQPFIPKYFGYAVALNKAGAPAWAAAVQPIPRLAATAPLEPGVLLIDARPAADFRAGHQPGAFNLQQGGKFETWLGSIVAPQEPFYLLAPTEASREELIQKIAKIGYEGQLRGALVGSAQSGASSAALSLPDFRQQPDQYTIVDVRHASEAQAKPLFAGAWQLPLPELRERVGEVPAGKPVVVHCAGGYRSAAGASLLAALRPDLTVFDLGEAVTSFEPVAAR